MNTLNLVTGKQDIGDPNKFNWLQPLESLHGRSFVQFFAGSNEVEENLDQEILIDKYKETLLSRLEGMYDMTSKTNQKYIEAFKTTELEMNIDYTTRNAIHDLIDYENQEVVRKNIKILLTYVADVRWESKISQEIFHGLMGRNL